MKALCVLVLVAAAVGIAACGSSDSTTGSEGSAQVEALRLEKEKAEVEAETAKAEAQKEAQVAQREAREARQASKRAAQAKVSSEQEAEPEPEPEPQEVPDVVGMRLPEARSTLGAAGYRTQAEHTDTKTKSHSTSARKFPPRRTVVTGPAARPVLSFNFAHLKKRCGPWPLQSKAN